MYFIIYYFHLSLKTKLACQIKASIKKEKEQYLRLDLKMHWL
jgi:hypothetical protein